MKLVLLTLVFTSLFFGIQLNAQEQFIDSLITQYNSSSSTEDQAELAIKISHNSINVDNERALLYSDKALKHAQEIEDQLLIAKANETKAAIFGSTGNFSVSVELYMQSLYIYEKLNNQKFIASTSNNIANAYLGVDDYDKAEEFYKKSYDAGLICGDTNAIAVPLVGLAILHENNGNTDKALEATLEAIPLFEGINRLDAMVVCYVNAATYCYTLNKKEEAFSWINKGKEVNKILNNKYFEGSILLNESKWLSEKGEHQEAMKLGEEALVILQSINSRLDVMTSHESLSNIYAATGKFEKAYSSLQQYLTLKDSLNEVNKTEIMEEMNAKYETSEKEKEIVSLNKEKEIQTLQNKKNTTILYIALAGIIVMLVLVVISYRAFKAKKKSNVTLQNKNTIIEEKNREILDSIQYAKRIQDAILPASEILRENLKDSFVYYQPKDIVAGDFYWFELIGNKVLFAAADCTGHGVPGALVSVVCHNALNRAVREFNLEEPAKILDKTRELVINTFSEHHENVKDGMDISLCSWDLKTNKLEWAGANNPLYLIRNSNVSKEIDIVAPDKQPVGKYENERAFNNHTMQLKTGDSFYLFSDGFMDQFGGVSGKKYKYSRFRDLLLSISDEKMDKQGDLLEKEFIKWKGNIEQLDDVCVIGVRV